MDENLPMLEHNTCCRRIGFVDAVESDLAHHGSVDMGAKPGHRFSTLTDSVYEDIMVMREADNKIFIPCSCGIR